MGALDEVESVARIGSYALDITTGQWASSKGLDAILGIDARFGRTVEKWISLVHPADRQAMTAYFTDDVLGRGQPFDRQYRIVRADNAKEAWVHGRGSLTFDRSGRPVRMLGTIADITDLRKTQEALVASEHRYAAIFEGAGEGIIVADRGTERFLWVNASACAMLGYSRDELLTMGITDIHPTDELPAVRDHFEAILAAGGSVARVIRCLRKDGTVLFANIQGTAVVMDGARCMVGFFTDVTELRRIEAQDRKLARALEAAGDAILITAPTGEIEYANPAFRELYGLQPGAPLDGLATAFASLQTPADGAAVQRRIAAAEPWSGDGVIRRSDGTDRIVEASISPVFEGTDTITGLVSVARDVTDERIRTIEGERLQERLRRSERNLAEAQRIAHIGSWEWDLLTNTAQRSVELHRIYGLEPEAIPGTPDAFLAYVHPDDRDRVREADLAAMGSDEPQHIEYRAVRPDGSIRILHDTTQAVHDANGTPIRLIGTVEDVTDRVAADEERTRLVSAVVQTSDSVIIADLAGTIQYVNPAFERVSGYRRDEVIGANPRILKSGRQSPAFYQALWRRLTRGQTWTGTLINRRKDGSLYEEEATISPMRDSDGDITGYIAVKRDVTALRAAESGLAGEFRERAEVAAALSHLQLAGSPEETAAVICDELVALPGVDVAAVFNFLDPKAAVTLAAAGPDGLPVAPGRMLPQARAEYLYQRAEQGPWAEAWRPRPEDGAYGQAMAQLGIKAVTYAPIRNGEGLLGVVAAGTADESYARHLIDHLPVVGEFAATASALLSGPLERGQRDARVQERVQRAMAPGGLWPVFQPIVDLASRAVVGYEALTRFADGTAPDRMIGDAHAVGLGAELEVACLAAALRAADALPQDAWLSLNVSSQVILHSSELRLLLSSPWRRLVLEVTEHAEIHDYEAVRRAVAGFGPLVSLAVDDAGAGFASLRHVVELEPRFLKVDISLVRHVDRDVTRQAMIAGLRHFAARVGCDVIAEGIEEPAELEALRELGISFGQGYLLGRPEEVGGRT